MSCSPQKRSGRIVSVLVTLLMGAGLLAGTSTTATASAASPKSAPGASALNASSVDQTADDPSDTTAASVDHAPAPVADAATAPSADDPANATTSDAHTASTNTTTTPATATAAAAKKPPVVTFHKNGSCAAVSSPNNLVYANARGGYSTKSWSRNPDLENVPACIKFRRLDGELFRGRVCARHVVWVGTPPMLYPLRWHECWTFDHASNVVLHSSGHWVLRLRLHARQGLHGRRHSIDGYSAVEF